VRRQTEHLLVDHRQIDRLDLYNANTTHDVYSLSVTPSRMHKLVLLRVV